MKWQELISVRQNNYSLLLFTFHSFGARFPIEQYKGTVRKMGVGQIWLDMVRYGRKDKEKTERSKEIFVYSCLSLILKLWLAQVINDFTDLRGSIYPCIKIGSGLLQLFL